MKCDERKNGIANKFQMDLKNIDPNGGNVTEINSKSSNINISKSMQSTFAKLFAHVFLVV
jgi:hypothetical protein